MKRILWLLLAVLLAGAPAGCAGEKDRGINKDKDRPREQATPPAK
jgi:hypothetical protein